jgi:hypothetical protein
MYLERISEFCMDVSGWRYTGLMQNGNELLWRGNLKWFIFKVIHPRCAFSQLNPQYSATRISIHFMALQPLPGLGLPQSVPPLVPVFSSSPSVYWTLPRRLRGFRNVTFFFRDGVVSPTPNPQPGGPGCPFSSGSSPLTCRHGCPCQ